MTDEILCKEKRILRLHLIYWAIIFGILSIVLLVIAPGNVNQNALENFSFASTIVSIVLAVVSIVYSFRSKSSANENIAGIREIEKNIDGKLQKFDTLEENITKDVQSAITEGVERAISGLKEDVRYLKDDQADVKQKLDVMANDQKRYFEEETQLSNNNTKSGVALANTSFIGKIAMLMACLSKSKGKPIDFNDIGEKISHDKDYYWGFYAAIRSSFSSKNDFEYVVEKASIFTIKQYNEQRLGDYNYWESLIDSDIKKEFSKDYLEEVKKYFSVM